MPSLPWSTVETSGKIWHKKESPLPKGDQFREHLNRLVIHPVFKDDKKDNEGNYTLMGRDGTSNLGNNFQISQGHEDDLE